MSDVIVAMSRVVISPVYMYLQVNSFVGAFHDAVILYAIALNETLQANRSITNGTEITRRMWGRTFAGESHSFTVHTSYAKLAYVQLLVLPN